MGRIQFPCVQDSLIFVELELSLLPFDKLLDISYSFCSCRSLFPFIYLCITVSGDTWSADPILMAGAFLRYFEGHPSPQISLPKC